MLTLAMSSHEARVSFVLTARYVSSAACRSEVKVSPQGYQPTVQSTRLACFSPGRNRRAAWRDALKKSFRRLGGRMAIIMHINGLGFK